MGLPIGPGMPGPGMPIGTQKPLTRWYSLYVMSVRSKPPLSRGMQ